MSKLSERAVMVHLRVCRWAGDRQDPNVTSEVCEAKGAAEAFLRHVAVAGGGQQTRKHKHGVLGAAAHALQHRFGLGHYH